MTHMVKHLILDKSLLRGTQTDVLCEFVKTHNVVLGGVLFYECVTTDEQRDVLLHRCRQAVLAGAVFCPSLGSIIHSEARNLKPFGSIVDSRHNVVIRETFCNDAKPYDPEAVRRWSTDEKRFVDHVKNNIAACRKNQQALQEEKKRWGDDIVASRPERLRDRAQEVDSRNLHDVGNKFFTGITDFPERFCLSEEWLTWQFTRVFGIWFLERAYLYQARGRMRRHDLEQDWADMGYVTLLARVDALLMHDDLWRDIAKAAFPEKDVFSSLEEVPESYRCDWVGA
jgi:hypothetical protein